MGTLDLLNLELAVLGVLISLLVVVGSWFTKKLRAELQDVSVKITKALQENLAPVPQMAQDIREFREDMIAVKKNSYDQRAEQTRANDRLGEAVEELRKNGVEHARLEAALHALEKNVDAMRSKINGGGRG